MAFALQCLLTEEYHRDGAAQLQHQVQFCWSCCSICCPSNVAPRSNNRGSGGTLFDGYFCRCTMHFEDSLSITHQQMHKVYNILFKISLKSLTLKHSHSSYMFWHIICHPHGALMVLAKITCKTWTLHSVKGVAAYREFARAMCSSVCYCAGRYALFLYGNGLRPQLLLMAFTTRHTVCVHGVAIK
jgi:hypothetical protein